MSRRLPALVIAVLAMIAIGVTARSTPPAATATFARPAAPWMPVAESAAAISDTWFCPGVPSTGEEGVGGAILIGNRAPDTLTARVTWLGAPGASVTETVEVAPFDRTVLDVGERLRHPMVGAVVEIDGGVAVVEQQARHPAGRPVAPCASDTSPDWYFAEGFTVGGSVNQLIMTNPFDDPAIVNIGFATAEGSRLPAAYQGIPIPERSVRIIDLGAPGAGAQGEDRLAVQVEATRGRIVAARAQHFLAGNRLGYTLSLGAPALRDQWWFAEGRKGPGFSERFSIYNPTDSPVEVDAIFLGVAAVADVEPIEVPARQVVLFDPGAVPTLPDGRHATVFSTRAEPSIVVERVSTHVVDGRPISSVVLGAPPSPDGYVAGTWYLTAGVEEPTAAALVVFNPDNSPNAITVSVIGPNGIEPVAGLEALEIAPASAITVDLISDEVIGRQLAVSASGRVFVERSLRSGLDHGRTASWLVPAAP